MTTTLRARLVWLGPGKVLAPGELTWDARGRLRSVRRARGPCLDLLVAPGLVNAHVHLQLGPLQRQRTRFVPWVRQLMGERASLSELAWQREAQQHLSDLLASGTTAVGEIDSSGASPALVRATGMAGRCYRELTGFHLGAEEARQLVAHRSVRGTVECGTGLSPHAPYSVSAALFRAAHARRVPLSVHVAETEEEQEFLRAGTGPFAVLLRDLGRLPAEFRPVGVGAVEHLERLGVLGPATQLVHCQHLLRGDAERIARSGSPVVVCPGTIAWFRREAPPVPAWLRRGIVVGLGTDSAASNREPLSMVAELARAARLWPAIHPEQLLAMATVHGAASIVRPDLGVLRRGGRMDAVAWPAGSDRVGPLLDRVLARAELPAFTWLRGLGSACANSYRGSTRAAAAAPRG